MDTGLIDCIHPTGFVTDCTDVSSAFAVLYFLRSCRQAVGVGLWGIGFVFQRLRAPASNSQTKWRRAQRLARLLAVR